jgi:hypothetical protein
MRRHTIKSLTDEACKAMVFALAMFCWIFLAASFAAITMGV